MTVVKFKRVAENAVLPVLATKGAAGFDLAAVGHYVIPPGEFYPIPTGLAFEIPEGFELQVRPRSGIAKREGVTVLNAPGTIDSDYRGEVKVLLINHGQSWFEIQTGDRIAQGVISEVPKVEIQEVEQLSKTERGDGGFGHSGMNALRSLASKESGISDMNVLSAVFAEEELLKAQYRHGAEASVALSRAALERGGSGLAVEGDSLFLDGWEFLCFATDGGEARARRVANAIRRRGPSFVAEFDRRIAKLEVR